MIPLCPVCSLPAHASETDDLDRHPECRPCSDCGASPAKVNDEHDDEPRCVECAHDEECRIERLRGGEPDREHVAQMRAHHFNEGV